MAPNIVDVPNQTEPENSRFKSTPSPSQSAPAFKGNHILKIFQSSLNLLAHILVGAVVGISLIFAFGNGLPLGATRLHIVLCVLGYQLLMAQAILSLSPHNGWSSYLKHVEKRRAHWILQLSGSTLAIVGSFIKILDKTVHWHTYHGQFALVALVFTTVSLINGLSSLWAYEIRRFVPGNLSKLTHICFGVVAFVTSSVTLCYGFEKNMFRGWVSDEIAYTVIAFTAIYTFIIIINPLITFFSRFKIALRR